MSLPDQWDLSPVVLGLIPGVLATPLLYLRNTVNRSCLFFLLLSISQAIACSGFKIDYCLPPTMDFQFLGNRFDDHRADIFRFVAGAVRFVLRLEPSGHAYFWYDCIDRFGLIFKAINNTHCDGYRTISDTFPWTDGKSASGERMIAKTTVVVLTSVMDPAKIIRAANRSLSRYKLSARPVDAAQFKASIGQFQAIVLVLVNRGDGPAHSP